MSRDLAMRRRTDKTPPERLAEGEWCWAFIGANGDVRTIAYRLPGWPRAETVKVSDGTIFMREPMRWDGCIDAPTIRQELDHWRDGHVYWRGHIRAGKWIETAAL